jgi:hypothetical protein
LPIDVFFRNGRRITDFRVYPSNVADSAGFRMMKHRVRISIEHESTIQRLRDGRVGEGDAETMK